MTVEERFWSKVDKEGPVPEHRPELGPCWLWTAGQDGQGYGKIRIGGRTDRGGRDRKAHRVAYELLVGPIPTGMELDHLCRNRACVNPAHVEPVTHAENCRRGNGGWNSAAKTHCPQSHEYDEQNTYVCRRGERHCRKCRRAAKARYIQRKREAA